MCPPGRVDARQLDDFAIPRGACHQLHGLQELLRLDLGERLLMAGVAPASEKVCDPPCSCFHSLGPLWVEYVACGVLAVECVYAYAGVCVCICVCL